MTTPAATRDFTILQKEISTRSPRWTMTFPILGTEDLTPRPSDDVRGTGYWGNEGTTERVAYSTAWAIWQHEDPDHHPALNAFRIHFQTAAPNQQINDRHMPEGIPQGFPQYPYEADRRPVADLTHQSPRVGVFHRRASSTQATTAQLLMVMDFGLDIVGPTEWWYQGGGEILGIYGGEVITEVRLSAMHPAYGFGIFGVKTGFLPTLTNF